MIPYCCMQMQLLLKTKNISYNSFTVYKKKLIRRHKLSMIILRIHM